jgi:nucleoid-associated protein YgaU
MDWIGDRLAPLHGDFPSALLTLITFTAVVVGAWAAVVGLLASTPALRGVAVALTPRLLRGLVFAGFAGAISIPAHADDRGIDGLRLPDRPLVTSPQEPEQVLVRRGDTLWAIVAHDLGPRATVATTARACIRWHAANRKVIGPDPDLIHPGQRLTPPKDRP